MHSIEAGKTEVFFTSLNKHHQREAFLKCSSRLYINILINTLKFVKEC